MKKILCLICALALTVCLLASCAEQIKRENLFERETAGYNGIGTGSPIEDDTNGVGKLESETTSGGIGGFDNDVTDDAISVYFPSTGKSDCIIVKIGDKSLIIDAGESRNQSIIYEKLDSLGIKSVDYMIVTHFDSDHIGCAAGLIRYYNVGKVYMPNYVRESVEYSAMMEALDGKNYEKVCDNITFLLGDAEVTVNPTHLYDGLGDVVIDRDDDEDLDAEENNFSLITRIVYKEKAILFLGDAENERIDEFITECDKNSDDKLDYTCSLIKLPHHGAYCSSLGRLIVKSGAFYGVVCTASAATVEKGLESAMSKSILYATYNGDIEVATDGNKFIFKQ